MYTNALPGVTTLASLHPKLSVSPDTQLDTRVSPSPGLPITSRSLNPDPVSDGLREAFQVVVFFIMTGVTSLFGIGANIINITVFVKQGFKDSINISLLGLAVADLGCLVTTFWMSVSFSPWFLQSDLPFNPLDVVYVTAGWPHVYFNRTTSLITAFITMERCLCVTNPLKIKTIITHSRTKFIISAIFSFAAVMLSPMFYVNQLQWTFDLSKNRTQLTLTFADSRVLIETITLPIYSVVMSTVPLVVVASCTVILIFKLKEKTKWRNMSTANGAAKMENVSARDRKVLQMVTFISSIFVMCFIPANINFLLMAYAPEFSLVGKYANLFLVVWTSTMFIEVINSSVNIFVYFKMSSKYRKKFLYLFCWCLAQECY